MARSLRMGCTLLAWTAISCAPEHEVDGSLAASGPALDAAGVSETAAELRGVQWGACPEGFRSECARVRVPLDWERPWGRSIELFIARYPAALPSKGARAKQLWLLAGGPGGSGDSFEDMLDTTFAPFRQTHDIYVIEHRGVGESTRLGCPAEEALDGPGGFDILPEEWPDCIAYLTQHWGSGLGQFNVTNAAQDLQHAIRLTRRPGQEVLVYGVSYGTLWAQRYLQISGDQADGVVLDSVVPPTDFSLFEYDAQTDPVGAKLASMCARDAVCGAKLGSDPWKFVRDTLAQVADGHCSELGMSRAELSTVAAELVTDITLRRHLFPLMYRLRRCDGADRAVLEHYAELLSGDGELPDGPERSSIVLQTNIALSELGTPTPSLEQLEQTCEQSVLCPGVSVGLRELYDVWPRYATDRYFGKWFHSRVPVLALNGELDPQTPDAEASRIAPVLRAPAQHYVQLPYSAHVTVLQSPVRDPDAPTCGAQIMHSFAQRLGRRPDTGCIAQLAPVDLDISSDEASFFFGAEDAYENGMSQKRRAHAPKARVDFFPIRDFRVTPLRNRK